MSEYSCCFKGYTPITVPPGSCETYAQAEDLRKMLESLLEEAIQFGYKHFICGFDLGYDIQFAEVLVSLKSKYPWITLESAIPYENQAVKWPETERERYYNLLSRCDVETLLQTQYKPNCIINRNKYMVKKSELVIAIFDGKLSGTMQTISYAKSLGKKIITIDPNTLKLNKNVQS